MPNQGIARRYPAGRRMGGEFLSRAGGHAEDSGRYGWPVARPRNYAHEADGCGQPGFPPLERHGHDSRLRQGQETHGRTPGFPVN